MLNIGMTEILCFAVIAILVLGPDKLPEAARFAGRWYARIKRHISNIQNEIDRELKISEFRKEMQDELNRIEALERKVQSQLEEIEKRKLSELEQTPQNHQEQQKIRRKMSSKNVEKRKDKVDGCRLKVDRKISLHIFRPITDSHQPTKN